MKKKHEEEHGSDERWLLTYADLITLLMVFFVILFAMASVDAQKVKTLGESMNIAFTTGGGNGGSNFITNFSGKGITPSELENANQNQETTQFDSMIRLIKEYADEEGIYKAIDTTITQRGLVVNLSDSVLFESGQTELNDFSYEVLEKLASILFKTESTIRVEGHTDNIPIRTARYQSNWQLSTDRATNVIMYWIEKHPELAPRLAAAGYGEFRPIASNDTPEGRAKNRRVEIVLLSKLEERKEPAKPKADQATEKHNRVNEDLSQANLKQVEAEVNEKAQTKPQGHESSKSQSH